MTEQKKVMESLKKEIIKLGELLEEEHNINRKMKSDNERLVRENEILMIKHNKLKNEYNHLRKRIKESNETYLQEIQEYERKVFKLLTTLEAKQSTQPSTVFISNDFIKGIKRKDLGSYKHFFYVLEAEQNESISLKSELALLIKKVKGLQNENDDCMRKIEDIQDQMIVQRDLEPVRKANSRSPSSKLQAYYDPFTIIKPARQTDNRNGSRTPNRADVNQGENMKTAKKVSSRLDFDEERTQRSKRRDRVLSQDDVEENLHRKIGTLDKINNNMNDTIAHLAHELEAIKLKQGRASKARHFD